MSNAFYDRKILNLEKQLNQLNEDNTDLQNQNNEIQEYVNDIKKEIAVNFDEIKGVLDGLKSKLKM